MNNQPQNHLPAIPSPDGRYTVLFFSAEMRMSHWIDCPAVIDTARGQPIFSLEDSLWSASGAWWREDSQRAVIDLRRYPGDAPLVTIEIDLPRHRAQVRTPEEQAEFAIEDPSAPSLLNWLEAWYKKNRANPT